jgi:hypothetical protein
MRLDRLLPRPATAMIAAAALFCAAAVTPPQPRAGGATISAAYNSGESLGEDAFFAPSYAAPLDLSAMGIR